MKGNKRAFLWQTFWKCHPFMLLRRPISYLLQQAFCVRYFRLESSLHCKSAANLPPLRFSASPVALFPPSSSPLPSTLLMWQNKPRPIRIKALKRSLKPAQGSFKPCNDNMSCVAVGQALAWMKWLLLLGAVARCHPTHTDTQVDPPLAKAPQVVQPSHYFS